MGNLQVGDQVFDEAGQVTNVIAIFDAMPTEAYRLEFSDGTHIDACGDHQWVTWDHAARKAFNRSQVNDSAVGFPENWPQWRSTGKGRPGSFYGLQSQGPEIRTTSEVVSTLTHGKRDDLTHCIPLCLALDLPEKDLPIDPWLFGYWLGNGSSRGSQLAMHAEDEEYVRSQVALSGHESGQLWQQKDDVKKAEFSVFWLVSKLREQGSLSTKHIPPDYLRGSIPQRKALLAGLLDSDGHIAATGGTVIFTNTNEKLIDTVVEVARSLGQKPVKTFCPSSLVGNRKGNWLVTWRPTFNPMWNPRKAANYQQLGAQALRNYHRTIKRATPIPLQPMRCITVDSPNSMYLAGKGMIPTHNSRAGSEWIVGRALKHPYDNHGVPTEWLVAAETLADARTICMEGPAGIIRVLERRKVKYRYKRSPRPMIIFPSGTKIYTEGADDPDIGRGLNLAGSWLDEICVAKNEPVVTGRGNIVVQDVRAGDQVMTRRGWRRVSHAGLTRPDAELLEIRTEAGTVRVTPEHRVWANGAWRQAKEVAPGHTMATCLPQMKNQSQVMPPPSTTGMVSAGTTTREWAITSTEVAPYSTAVSGSRFTAPFRTATKSTTSTVNDGTIDWKTSNNLPSQTIVDLPFSNGPMRHGTRADRSAPVRASLSTGRSGHLDPSSVLSAAQRTSALACEPSSVARNVERQLGDRKTETLVLDVVKVNPADVYDITVEGDAPEFYAGSGRLLVHNCKWRFPKRSWEEGIMPALRADLAGSHPQAFVTTTPKPINILQEWVSRNDGTVHVIRGSTFDNASNLSALVIQELKRRYDGTNVGRQELYGELIEGFDGALFSRLDIEDNRLESTPDNIANTVVGVDPSLTGEDDEMGIVVVSRDRDNHLYVLADRSIMSVGRAAALETWRVVAEWGADMLICEVTIGKRWMQQVFHDAYYELVGQGLFPENTKPPIKGIDSKSGKRVRGEPVAMRCEQGKLHMVGHMPELENQMAMFTGWGNRESPDRLDALVHACRFLMEGEKKQVRIASPRDVLSTTLQSLWNETGSYNTDF